MTARSRNLFAVSLLPVLITLASCASSSGADSRDLIRAVEGGDVGSVEEIVSGSVNVDSRDDEGRTALHLAVDGGDLQVAAALLDAGADPDITDRNGRSALHYAVMGCSPDMIAMILAAGVDVAITDDDERTALQLADAAGCEDARPIIESSLPEFVPAE